MTTKQVTAPQAASLLDTISSALIAMLNIKAEMNFARMHAYDIARSYSFFSRYVLHEPHLWASLVEVKNLHLYRGGGETVPTARLSTQLRVSRFV